MRMSDLIVKKRDGQALTTEEIRYMIDGYSRGDRKSTRLNSSHTRPSRMPSPA